MQAPVGKPKLTGVEVKGMGPSPFRWQRENERVNRHIQATFIFMVETAADEDCWVAFPLCTSVQN